MRSIWSGTLSFGLINIPIRLYSGTDEHPFNFDMLHKTDLSPIRFARICKTEEKEVPYKDIVKGYEYQKGEYLVIEDEDFKKVISQKTDTIEIVSFAHEDEIDPIYFEKPYFLEPGKGADKSYALLRETLRKSKKVGVVKFVLRNRAHIGIIKPYQDAIILDQMRYATEVRQLEGLKLPSEKTISKKELDMALKLVEQLTDKFNPNAYEDTYAKDMQAVIDAKLKGAKPLKKAPPPKESKVHDIMSLLKASLEEGKPAKAKPRARKHA